MGSIGYYWVEWVIGRAFVRDFAVVSFVFFVSRVSCFFGDERDKRDDRDGSEVGHQRCRCRADK